MLFRQLFEPVSSTYTYLLGCEESGLALLIDPVLETAERDLAVVQALGLKLAYTLETHIHADHLSGARKLKALAGSAIAAPGLDGLSCVDLGVAEGTPFRVGGIALHPLHTPGHTANHHAYLLERDIGARVFSGDALLIGARVFSGDALLIDGCGRTDFQGGDSYALFRSVREKLFGLADETLVYPAHDYEGRFVSSIAQEKARNARLGLDKSLEDFVRIMDRLKLPYPQKMDFAVPGNRMCGQCPPNVPEEFRDHCG